MVRPVAELPTWDEVVAIADGHSITRLGVAPADVLDRARAEILRRKAAGLHAGMGFTYRNPERSTDPQRAVAGAKSIIAAARPYRLRDEPERPPGAQARVARYAWVDHYAPLRAGLREIALRIRRAGHKAVVFADDNSIVDREVAYRAGLGWFGKNANVLIPGAGSYFVLGCIVTTAEYPLGEPVPDGCGTCRRCLDGCPTGAIVAPGVVDANRCLAWLVQQPGRSRSSSARRSATDCTGATTARRSARRRSDSARGTASTSSVRRRAAAGVGRCARHARCHRRAADRAAWTVVPRQP